MSLPPQDDSYTTSHLTKDLRFIRREGRFILQQAHKVMRWMPKGAQSPVCTDIRFEWRDVPLVEAHEVLRWKNAGE